MQTECCISAVTLAEIRRGIDATEDAHFRAELALWLRQDVEEQFGARVLAADEPVLRCWPGLMAAAKPQRHTWSQPDALIAATAIIHRCAIVTRNTVDFVHPGVPLLDPWQG